MRGSTSRRGIERSVSRGALRSLVGGLIFAALTACVDQESALPLPLRALHQRALAGEPLAQWELGMRYLRGHGVAADEKAARRWISQAAHQGYAQAQYELGSYFTLAASRDDEQAVHWLRQAAEQGHAGAQYSMGVLYWVGRGVVADASQAYAWLSLAADQGEGDAQQARRTLAQRMTTEQLHRAQRRYREFRAP